MKEMGLERLHWSYYNEEAKVPKSLDELEGWYNNSTYSVEEIIKTIVINNNPIRINGTLGRIEDIEIIETHDLDLGKCFSIKFLVPNSPGSDISIYLVNSTTTTSKHILKFSHGG